jgi:RecA-family ATPase
MTGRDVVIVDSLRAATAGTDENDSGIRAALDMLGGLSEQTGCRALVIHHARKQGKDDPGGRYAIRGSSAIFDAVDSAYLFGAEKGEPIHVEQVKARSHGEPADDFALVISDVDAHGDPKAGLRVQLHGAELVTLRREQRHEAAQRVRADRDADKVRAAIAAVPGIGTRDLRARTSLSGDRLAAALAALDDRVDVRETPSPAGRAKVCHYLRSET